MLRLIYCCLLAVAIAFLAFAISQKNWLQTDLTVLLPEDARPDRLLLAADAVNERELNAQVVLLLGAEDGEKAFQMARDTAQKWRQSGVFARVDGELTPDLAKLGAEAKALGVAALPATTREQLMNAPQDYFRARAEAAVNPFEPALLPPDEDWLGLAGQTLTHTAPQGKMQWDMNSGMLFSVANGKTWVWLRGVLPDGGFAASDDKLLNLINESKTTAQAAGMDTLMAGGALFAAVAKQDAQRESQIMGALGTALTFTLLLTVFRSGRAVALLLPIAAGLIFGLAATVMLLGQIHVLTVVIGTSLVGMLVDFPLHWLVPSLFAKQGFRQPENWQAQASMREVLPAFGVSLAVTVSGYILLWFTPLPVLRQTAIFSAFALLGAFGATVWLLPALFRYYQPKPTTFASLAEKLVAWHLPQKKIWLSLLAILVAVGIAKSQWRDDIRQWVSMQPEMLVQAQQIGELSGSSFGAQLVLVEGKNDEELLQRSRAITTKLQDLVAQQKLDNVQSLSDWFVPPSEQQMLKKHLRDLAGQPENWVALSEIGAESSAIKQALLDAANAPDVNIQAALQGEAAQAWKMLYLGEVEPSRYAAIVRLSGLHDTAAAEQAVQGLMGVHWVDKRAHLNHLFEQTRNQAAWLKLVSFVAAWLLLWKMFGAQRGMKILTVPLAAAACSVALLGWLELPVSLFAMFGLLLTAAVGVDYAVYATAAPHAVAARLGGMILAAMTTLISFGLLAISSTPAVASFGITVAAGVVFALLFATLLLKSK